MQKYKVTAEVDSSKHGKGQLVAQLTHDQFVKYANLSDDEKLKFLKDNNAELLMEAHELEDSDVKNYKVENMPKSEVDGGESKVTRKMRMNINGKDTGWVDVTDENEEEYNQMLEQFNEMNQRFEEMNRHFDERFRNFFDFSPSSLLDFASSPLRLNTQSEDNEKIKEETKGQSQDNDKEQAPDKDKDKGQDKGHDKDQDKGHDKGQDKD